MDGISGGIVNQILNRSSGFAFTAQGKSSQFKQHHIFGIRGSKSLADWLTNGNVATVCGPRNLEVHSGIQKVFSSLQDGFNKYLVQHNPKCLHCVGHSLGGAIAELTAIWASDQGIPTKLYTFGAARVITSNYVHRASYNLEHYRVTHGADPVPNVPLWPFSHTVGEFQTAMNSGAFYSTGAHAMEESTPGYVNTVRAYKNYGSMSGTFKALHHKYTVLQYEQRHNATFSMRWQEEITNALITFLKKTGQYSLIAVQAGIGLGAQFYDLIARSLYYSVKKTPEVAGELKGLLGHMLVFVGQRSTSVKEMSIKFIHWVFGLMVKKLYITAKHAIERVF